jgi:hypothetical protein
VKTNAEFLSSDVSCYGLSGAGARKPKQILIAALKRLRHPKPHQISKMFWTSDATLNSVHDVHAAARPKTYGVFHCPTHSSEAAQPLPSGKMI